MPTPMIDWNLAETYPKKSSKFQSTVARKMVWHVGWYEILEKACFTHRKFNMSPLISYLALKGKDRFPTIHFSEAS